MNTPSRSPLGNFYRSPLGVRGSEKDEGGKRYYVRIGGIHVVFSGIVLFATRAYYTQVDFAHDGSWERGAYWNFTLKDIVYSPGGNGKHFPPALTTFLPPTELDLFRRRDLWMSPGPIYYPANVEDVTNIFRDDKNAAADHFARLTPYRKGFPYNYEVSLIPVSVTGTYDEGLHAGVFINGYDEETKNITVKLVLGLLKYAREGTYPYQAKVGYYARQEST